VVQGELHQRLECRDQLAAQRREGVQHLHWGAGDNSALDEILSFELFEADGEEPVGDADHHPPVVAEAARAPRRGDEDRTGPPLADQLHHALDAAAIVVVDALVGDRRQ